MYIKKYSHSSQGIISFNFHKWHCSKNSHICLARNEYGWRLYFICMYVFILKMNCFMSSYTENIFTGMPHSQHFYFHRKWKWVEFSYCKNWWNSLSRQNVHDLPYLLIFFVSFFISSLLLSFLHYLILTLLLE